LIVMEADRDLTGERLRQAEALVPELKEKMEREGWSEQQLADVLNQRLSSGEASRRRGFRPSQHPLGVALTLLAASFLGYLRQFDSGHNAKTRCREDG
jgi:hypothetical protein